MVCLGSNCGECRLCTSGREGTSVHLWSYSCVWRTCKYGGHCAGIRGQLCPNTPGDQGMFLPAGTIGIYLLYQVDTANTEPSLFWTEYQIAEMASDVLECSKIAKKVAIKITERLHVGDIITRDAPVETKTLGLGCATLAGGSLSLSFMK